MAAEISEWIAPDGTVTLLDVDWEASGRYMPEVAFQEDEVPGEDGSRMREARFLPHEFTLKLTLVANTEGDLRAGIRSLLSTMNPKRGEGAIRVTSPIGDQRLINCRVSAGLGLEEKEGLSGPEMQQAVVTFRAFDPLWKDVSETSQSFVIGASRAFFPIFPLTLTSSQIVVSSVITNDGDDEMWPVWRITGPGSVISLTNATTGKTLTLSTVLGVGESITVDTRPGHKTVKRQDGANLWADVDISTSLWPLAIGTNSIQLAMAGATVGASALQVNYQRRYLSP